MKQRKIMRGWQFGIAVALMVIMLVTMFLPAIKINGTNMYKLKVTISNPTSESVEVSEADAAAIEEIDKSIAALEEECDINISSLSPFRIMTQNLVKAFENAGEEEFAEVISGYNTVRVIMWIVYVLLIVLLLIVILGFFLKWTKYISLIVNAVYGLVSAIIFGWLRFGLAGSIGKKIISVGGFGSLGVVEDAITKILSKCLSCFYSIAFLIAFIVAILILLTSVVFMFIGNGSKAAEVEEDVDDIASWEPMPAPLPEINPIVTERPEMSERRVEPAKPVKPVKPVRPPMGQVRCSKGLAFGQGFMLPEDKKVIIGKSPQNANLVINSQHISNVHCSIRYNAARNTYIIKDHSMNGTFVNGVRLQKDVSMEYPAGTILSLADGSNEVTLG